MKTWWLKTTKFSFSHVASSPLRDGRDFALCHPYSRTQAKGVFSIWDIIETQGNRAWLIVYWLLELPLRSDMYHFYSYFIYQSQLYGHTIPRRHQFSKRELEIHDK